MTHSRLITTLAIVGLSLCVTGSVAVASTSAPPPVPSPGGSATGGEDVARSSASPATSQDLFTPLTPCRAVNTNLTSPIAAHGTQGFRVAGTTGFAPQGGTHGGCGVPSYATAISATITSVHAMANGRLTLFPVGTSAPNTISLSYSKGIAASTGTTASFTWGAGAQLDVKASSKTDVIVDILGYYSPQIYGTFTTTGALYNGNGTLQADSHPDTGYYTVLANRDLTGCTPVVSAYYYNYDVTAYVEGQLIHIEMTTATGAAADYYFHVQVTC